MKLLESLVVLLQPELEKEAASVEELHQALSRLPIVRHRSFDLAHVGGPGTFGKIHAGAGGAFRQLMDSVGPGSKGKLQAMPGPSKKALNVTGVLHEAAEARATKVPHGGNFNTNFLGRYGHAGPGVIISENNMLAGMTGEGSDDARRVYRGLRRNRETPELQHNLAKFDPRAAAEYGTHGEKKIPKSLRKALVREWSTPETDAIMNSLPKTSSALEKEAAIKKEKRRPWNVANHRSGRRPMRVETMLKKEKDGTLQSKFAEALEKVAQFYGPIVPFSDIADKGAAPRGKKNPDNIPSTEDPGPMSPKREDGRANLVTEMAPGTHLNDVAATNQPQERTASVKYTVAEAMLDKVAGLRDYILSNAAEKHTDLGGLGLMAGSSIDKLRSQLKHPEDPEKGSLVGGTAGRSGMDLTGLAAMAAPTVARLVSGHGDKFTNVANLAGLGALAAPTLDNVQAGIRARREGVDPEKKMLLGHGAHAGLELAGLGTLAAPVARGGLNPHSAMTLAGYGTLAAPVAEDLVQHDEKKKLFQGAGRSATELAGLGLLAGGAMAHGH